MPLTHFLLGLVVLSLAVPWISGDLIDDVNGTVVSSTNLAHDDNTRREDVPRNHEQREANFEREDLKDETDDVQSDPVVSLRMYNQPLMPAEELTDFQTDVTCDNAQFLLKILTVMLPLLKNEVPESSRTSYVLLILKDLLKASPEAAQDYNILYKINDLILSLEKYHKNDAPVIYDENFALRKQTNAVLPDGIKSKIVFKYEVPQLANPSCTAELLQIIKVVQKAIIRLVNNPLCKTIVPIELPLFVNFEEYFNNPDLYSYLPPKTIIEKPIYVGEDIHRDVEEIKIPSIPKIHTIYGIKPETITVKPQEKYPYLPISTTEIYNINPYYVPQDYPTYKPTRYEVIKTVNGPQYVPVPPDYYADEITYPPDYYDIIPTPPSIEFKPDIDDIKRPKYPNIYFPTKKDVYEIKDYPNPNPIPYDLKKYYIPYPVTTEFPQFEIIGRPESAYIPFGPPIPDDDEIYYIRPGQDPKKPNKYGSAPETRPTIIGVPEPVDFPYTPNNPYEPYWPIDYEDNKPIISIFNPANEPRDIKYGPTTEHPIEFIDIIKQPYGPQNPYNSNPSHRPYPKGQPDKPEYRPDDDVIIPQLYPIISKPKKLSTVTVVNPYEPVEDILQYQDIPYYPNVNTPTIWGDIYPNNDQKKLPHPDKKILQIIKENIEVVEHKIPYEYLSPDLLEMMRKLKQLLDLEEITVEEYVNIINEYQIFIENVKHINISNAVMQDLLLSITNLDKLDLITGKSKDIEFTYLIKRPKPLVYQPYYYIKYRLPYNKFLIRIEKLIADNPYLTDNPAKLYKALIPISEVVETSPDLHGYGQDDILRLIFNDGTLVGAKVVKANDVELYKTIEQLQNINSDLSVDDTYQLIRNLEASLSNTPEGLFVKNSNIPVLNIEGKPHEIRIKVNKKPILKKITKITTNKVAADKIISDILNKVKYMRSNKNDSNDMESVDPLLETVTQAVDDAKDIGRTRDDYGILLNDPTFPYKPQNDIYLQSDSLLDTNPSLYNLPAGFHPSGLVPDTDLNLNPYGLGSSQMHGETQSFKDTNLDLEETQRGPLHSSSLIQALFHNRTKYNPEIRGSDLHFVDSPLTPASTDEFINRPKTADSYLTKYSQTYINGLPVKNSKTYLINKGKNLENFETTNLESQSNTADGLQNFNDKESFIENYNILDNLASETANVPLDDTGYYVKGQSAIDNQLKPVDVLDTFTAGSYSGGANNLDQGTFSSSFGQNQVYGVGQDHITGESNWEESNSNLEDGKLGSSLVQNQALGGDSYTSSARGAYTGGSIYNSGLGNLIQNQGLNGLTTYTIGGYSGANNYNIPSNLLGLNGGYSGYSIGNLGSRYRVVHRRPSALYPFVGGTAIRHPLMG